MLEWRLPAERAEPLECLNQGVLNEVGNFLLISTIPSCHREKPWRISFDNLLEGIGLTSLYRGNDLLVRTRHTDKMGSSAKSAKQVCTSACGVGVGIGSPRSGHTRLKRYQMIGRTQCHQTAARTAAAAR